VGDGGGGAGFLLEPFEGARHEERALGEDLDGDAPAEAW
jgi:hypothetical protein